MDELLAARVAAGELLKLNSEYKERIAQLEKTNEKLGVQLQELTASYGRLAQENEFLLADSLADKAQFAELDKENKELMVKYVKATSSRHSEGYEKSTAERRLDRRSVPPQEHSARTKYNRSRSLHRPRSFAVREKSMPPLPNQHNRVSNMLSPSQVTAKRSLLCGEEKSNSSSDPKRRRTGGISHLSRNGPWAKDFILISP